MSGQSGGRLKLAKLNEQLTCQLCKGYFIDATTIIECLHSFCRSCIVKYLETDKYCPICEAQVHKSKPLLNIRPDHTLQDIVYKLVPGCYQNEMRCRREFYEKHPEAQLSTMSPEARGEPIESHIYSPDESLSLSLEYYNPSLNDSPICSETDEEKSSSSSKIQPRRYLRCPAAVTVFHLQKLIRAKYGLSDVHRVDIMYKEEPLYGNYTLMDVMYIYHWRRKVPLHLSYRIFESSPKRIKLSDDNEHFKQSLTNAGISPLNQPLEDQNGKREWKEVQLKISETGVMSVTGITSPDSKKPQKKETLEEEQRRLDETVASTKPVKSEKIEPKRKSTEEKDIKIDEKPKKSSDKDSESEDNNNRQAGSNNNNKSDSSSSKSEIQKTKNDSKINVGSKIESLSARLQFQPKVGQVNNTYSKKSQKDKKTMLEKVLKKSDKIETKEKPKSLNLTNNKPVKSSTAPTNSTSGSVINAFGGCTYSTAPSVSISLTSRRNSSPERSKEAKPEDENPKKLNNLSQETSNSAKSLALNVPVIGIGSSSSSSSSSSSFPHYVQDLVASGMLKTPVPPKSPSTSQFNIQTPSMSIYTIPPSSASKLPPNSSPTTPSVTITTTASSATSTASRQTTSAKGNVDITTVYSVPPCPDAIPISLMKPTVRKTEIIAKGTNVNEICAKISNTGSKINDICAKIGENSRERDKNKNERPRPEIPDLLKITKKTEAPGKHQTIPNVPTYTPSSLSSASSEAKAPKPVTSVATSSGLTNQPIMLHKSNQKKQTQSLGFKTLRDPPKPWNPTLSKNNYVAAKNQAKEMNDSGNQGSSKPLASKLKIFKVRNTPRYLGNPASGVKPMYGVNNDGNPSKDSKDSSAPSKNQQLGMTKIDPKTLSPIVSTSSPILSPPPYSPNSRNYSSPFSRELSRQSGSLSPRNSPVNMLSTNPFIPTQTPNTNPRLFCSPFAPPFTDTSRFTNSLIRQPIGIPSAFHSSLPPSINKLYQRSYMPQTAGGYLQQSLSQPPTVQRIPASSHSSVSPKSPKAAPSAAASSTSTVIPAKSEAMEDGKSSGSDGNAFNLTKIAEPVGASGPSDLSKGHEDHKVGDQKLVGKERERRKSEEAEVKEKPKEEVKAEEGKMAEKEEKREEAKANDETEEAKVNGGNGTAGSSETAEENGDKVGNSDTNDKVQSKENKVNENEKTEESCVSESKCEEIKEIKAAEAARNKAES